ERIDDASKSVRGASELVGPLIERPRAETASLEGGEGEGAEREGASAEKGAARELEEFLTTVPLARRGVRSRHGAASQPRWILVSPSDCARRAPRRNSRVGKRDASRPEKSRVPLLLRSQLADTRTSLARAPAFSFLPLRIHGHRTVPHERSTRARA